MAFVGILDARADVLSFSEDGQLVSVDPQGIIIGASIDAEVVSGAEDNPQYQSSDVANDEIKRLILMVAKEEGLDPLLLSALVAQESNYNPIAVSHAGAMGLAQLMPATAERHGVVDPFDPVENLRGGAAELKRLMSIFDTLALVLAAYNAGQGAVETYQGIPPYRETQDYVRRVMGRVIEMQQVELDALAD